MVKVYAERLADLVLRKGVNLKKDQCLTIVVGPKSYEYASVMARWAYKLGAKYVNIVVSDPRVNGARSIYQESDENLCFVPSFLKAYDYEQIAEEWARVRIDSGEDRVEKFESNLDNLQKISKSSRISGKEYSARTMSNQLSWNVCAVPGPEWAKEILGENATEEDLAEVMAKILKIDSVDYLEKWDAFDDACKRRMDWLNNLKIKTLHYKSPKTDFKVSFTQKARFSGGSGYLPDGSAFFANLPTEEIFSTPDMNSAEGYITTTRPVTVLDNLTEEVTLYFEKGKVVDVKAKTGLDIMKKYLSIDEGAKRLGEVALVDETSPICQSGLVFGSILIDENASCHIALGAGYPECLKTENPMKSDEDMLENKCNVSLVHTDFMVGSKDLDIFAETYDGQKVQIMKQGLFLL